MYYILKKVININFQGRVVPIEETAYDLLKQYTDSLRVYFASEEGKDEIINDIEMDDVLAWKNGFFSFEGADIETVMRQLSRWYDIEVTYNKSIDERFYAEIPSNLKLSDVLKALEFTGKIKFGIDGKKVIVL